jgi:4-amino-4-deoxy-L-arabinose transferase-like glycosyltransferase
MAPGHSLLTRGVWGSAPMKGAATRWMESNPDSMTFFQPPLYLLLVAGSFKFLGFGLLQSRLVSVLLGAATVVVTYLLTLEIKKSRISATVASVLLLTQPLFIRISRQTRPESAVVFSTVLGMYAFTKYWKERKSTWALLVGAALGMASMAHYNGFFGVLAFFTLFFMIRRPKEAIELRGLAFYVLGVSISCLPYAFYVLRDYGTGFYNFRTQLSVIGRVGCFNTFLEYLQAEVTRYQRFFHDYRFVSGGALFVKVVYSAILAFALVRRNKLYRLLLVVIIVHLALLLYPSPNKTSLYLGVVLPFIGTLVGLSLFDLGEIVTERFNRLPGVFGLFGAVLVLVFVGINAGVWVSYHKKYRECDFYNTIAQIRHTLPASVSSIMGRYTFWIGLNDHNYYRWGFRDFEDIKTIEPEIFIHNDYRMTRSDLSDFKATLDEYLQEHGEMIGEVKGHPRNFCRVGDLKIYRVKWEH